MRNDARRYRQIIQSPPNNSMILNKRHIKSLPSKHQELSAIIVQTDQKTKIEKKQVGKRIIDYNQCISSDNSKDIRRYRPTVLCRKAINYASDKYNHNQRMKIINGPRFFQSSFFELR